VDDSLFDQAPQEEAAAPAPEAAPAAVEDAPLGAPPAAPATSRFNMDTLEEKKPALQVNLGQNRPVWLCFLRLYDVACRALADKKPALQVRVAVWECAA
jgi:hypothetical protein